MQEDDSYVDVAKVQRPMTWHPIPSNSIYAQDMLLGPYGNSYAQLSSLSGHVTSSPIDGAIYPFGLDLPSPTHIPVTMPHYQTQESPYGRAYYDHSIHSCTNAEPMYTNVYSSPSKNASWYMPVEPPMSPAHPIIPHLQSQQSFLTIQPPPELEVDVTPGTPADEEFEREDSNELIGMGLYDPPATPPHPFMSASGRGKGLKLEEAWAPPPSDSDDEADGEQSLENEHEDILPPLDSGLPTASQNVAQQLQWAIPPRHPHVEPSVLQSNLQGQTFFFEDDGGAVGALWGSGGMIN